MESTLEEGVQKIKEDISEVKRLTKTQLQGIIELERHAHEHSCESIAEHIQALTLRRPESQRILLEYKKRYEKAESIAHMYGFPSLSQFLERCNKLNGNITYLDLTKAVNSGQNSSVAKMTIPVTERIYEKIDNPYGRRLGEELKKRGKAQQWLADNLDTSKNTINNCINGQYIPSSERKMQIEKLLQETPVLNYTELTEFPIIDAAEKDSSNRKSSGVEGPQTYGRHLREEIRKREQTYKWIAKKIGTTEGVIKNYVVGRGRPTSKREREIEQILQATPVVNENKNHYGKQLRSALRKLDKPYKWLANEIGTTEQVVKNYIALAHQPQGDICDRIEDILTKA
jgi:ribosome-binding protein aMBF1 (putative translation factor)